MNDICLADYLGRIVAIFLIERPEVGWLMFSACSDNWMRIHRLLLQIHEELEIPINNSNCDQLILKLGLEISILEAMIGSIFVDERYLLIN